MTVTSRLHGQKDQKRQRNTEENVERRPVLAPGAGVRGRGSSIGEPGAGLRIAFAKNLRGQGSRLSTRQAEGGPHASEEAAPPPTVGFRGIDDDDVYDQFIDEDEDDDVCKMMMMMMFITIL